MSGSRVPSRLRLGPCSTSRVAMVAFLVVRAAQDYAAAGPMSAIVDTMPAVCGRNMTIALVLVVARR